MQTGNWNYDYKSEFGSPILNKEYEYIRARRHKAAAEFWAYRETEFLNKVISIEEERFYELGENLRDKLKIIIENKDLDNLLKIFEGVSKGDRTLEDLKIEIKNLTVENPEAEASIKPLMEDIIKQYEILNKRKIEIRNITDKIHLLCRDDDTHLGLLESHENVLEKRKDKIDKKSEDAQHIKGRIEKLKTWRTNDDLRRMSIMEQVQFWNNELVEEEKKSEIFNARIPDIKLWLNHKEALMELMNQQKIFWEMESEGLKNEDKSNDEIKTVIDSAIYNTENSIKRLDKLCEDTHGDKKVTQAEREAHDCVGLAFSGGGMRSAAFNLGIMQGLSKLGILPYVDYLTSISGGGLSAACLTSLLSAEPTFSKLGLHWERFPFNPNIKIFKKNPANDEPQVTTEMEPAGNVQVSHLRDKGNFLAPRKGMLSRDLLRAIGAILGGVSYTLILFLLAVFAIAGLLYLTTALISPMIIETPIGICANNESLSAALIENNGGNKQDTPSIITCIFELFRKSIYVLSESDYTPIKIPWEPYITIISLGIIYAIGYSVYFAYQYQPGLSRRVLDKHSKKSKSWGRTPQEIYDSNQLFRMRIIYVIFLLISIAVVILLWIKPMWEGEFQYRHQVFLVWLPLLFSIGTFLGINIVRLIDVVHRDPVSPGNDGLGGFFHFIGINLKHFIYKFLPGKNMPGIYTSLNVWSAPKFRTVFWAYLGGLYYFIPALLILTMLMLPHFFKLGDQATNPLSTAILSAIGVALLSYINGKGRPDSTKPFQKFLDFSEGIRNALLTILLFILIISLFFIFSTWIDQWVEGKEFYSSMTAILVVTIESLGLFFLISWFINYNYISHHYFYRDRIVDAFLKTEFNMKIAEEREKIVVARDHSSMKLININPKGSSTPYHIVVTAINLPGSWYLRFKDRKSQQFIFSRYWCGSEITGYLPSIEYRSGLTRYSRTIALSGAAISPGLGYRTFFAQAFAFTMLNVRLGLWMDNPIYYHNQKKAGSYFERWKGPIHHEQNVLWPRYLYYEAFASMNERKKLINITDGGHTGDNGGLYPLFKRRCRVIIAGDASLDPDYKGEQLFKVLNQVKTDEGIEVEIDIQGIKPEGGKEGDQERGYSKHHFAVGKIDYPETESAPKSDGWLIYFKPAVCESDPGWIKYYQEMHKGYPHPDTADQFYDEEQLEAQRMLGEESVIIAFGDILLKAIREDVSRVEEVEKKIEQIEDEVMQEPENIQTALKTMNHLPEEENSSKKEQRIIDKESEKPENRDMLLRKSLNQGLNFFSLYNKCPFTEDNLVSLYLLSKSTKSINEPKKLDIEN